jgi:hypothetical protein
MIWMIRFVPHRQTFHLLPSRSSKTSERLSACAGGVSREEPLILFDRHATPDPRMDARHALLLTGYPQDIAAQITAIATSPMAGW